MAAVVQSISSPPGDSHTFEQLPEAIKTLEHGKDIDCQGASGAIDLDPAGDATAGVYDVYEYDGEDLELVDGFRSIPARNRDGRLPRAARS